MKPKSQPPVPPEDAMDLMPPGAPRVTPPPVAQPPVADAEQTIDFVRSAPPASHSRLASLLPPGAEAEPIAPPAHCAPQSVQSPAITAPAMSAHMTPKVSAPVPQGMPIVGAANAAVERLSPEEKTQLRFWKNAVVFGVLVVVLLVVCLLLAR